MSTKSYARCLVCNGLINPDTENIIDIINGTFIEHYCEACFKKENYSQAKDLNISEVIA